MNGSQMRETSLANLELGDRSGNLNSTTNDEQSAKKEVKPKRNIAKQPLLNADRVLGKRGIRELEKIFRDFEPRGINQVLLLQQSYHILDFFENFG